MYTLFYEYYDTPEALKNKLKVEAEHIQCVVANNFIDTEIAFGKTQKPELWDYADNVNVIDFLLKI